MPQTVDSNTSDLEQIAARLHDLECRVAVLEAHRTTSGPEPSQQGPSSSSSQLLVRNAYGPQFSVVKVSAAAMPVLGKGVLGIAGAYLLRALAEAGPIPPLPVLIMAIVYAGLWMVWAVKANSANRFASATYGVTSVAILSPLLWESTERFHVMSPILTAGVMVAFTILVLALSRRTELQLIPWAATLAIVITDLGLIVTTHELVPLTIALLAIAAITEIFACLGYPMTWRAVPAVAADFGIWLLVDVMTSAGGVPEDYHPASSLTVTLLCVALTVIYGGSIAVSGFAQRKKFTVFEIIQSVVGFGVAAFGILRAAHGLQARYLGSLFLLLAAACYWGALSHFGDERNSRNRRVSAAWAAALLMAGTFLVFPVRFQVLFFCVVSLAGAFLYSRTRKFSLGLHTSFYLVAASAVSPLPAYVAGALAGQIPSAPSWNIWIVGASAALCYWIGGRVPEDHHSRRLLWVVPAALVGSASTAILVVVISRIASGEMEITPSRLSVIRTIIICVVASMIAFVGSRWKQVELGWVAYSAVALGTIKLLLEDLRFGNALSLVASLLCYGSILILLPRLTRRATA